MSENSVVMGEKGIEFRGKLNSKTAEDMSKQLDKVLKDVKGPLPVLNLEPLEDMSPAGLRVLLKLRDNYDQVNIFKTNDHIFDVLTRTKSLGKFNVFGKIEKLDDKYLKDAKQKNIGAQSHILELGKDRVMKKYNNSPYSFGYKEYPIVFDEFMNMQNMYEIGIPCPIAEAMVRVDDSYGIIMEKINGKDFGDYMLADMDRAPAYVREYVKFVKKASPKTVDKHKFPNHKDIIHDIRRILVDNKVNLLNGDVLKKMEEIFDHVKEGDYFIHGDNHLRNCMVTKDREMFYIDNAFCGFGNPIWDMLTMNLVYGLMVDEDLSNGQSLAMATLTGEQGHYVYDLYCKEYLETENEKVIEEVKRDVNVLTWIVNAIQYSIYYPDIPEVRPIREAGLNEVKRVVEDYYDNHLHTIGL